MSGASVKVSGLAKSFGRGLILKDLDLNLKPGESLALVGASGCGKTTILKILAGLCPYDRGEVKLEPSDLVPSFVSQDLGLYPWKTVWENLELPLVLAGRDKKARNTKVKTIQADMGLEGLDGRYPHELSGGQKQRVALGRALIVNPSVLLLDEPFSALDALTRESLGLHLASLWSGLGLTMILATHSIEEAVFLGQTIAVLGGCPTEVTAVFRNPGPKTPAFLTDRLFLDLVRKVRLALAVTGGQKTETWEKSGRV